VLGGVSFEDDADMDVELSLSAEEQLQYRLDSLRDTVIKQHSVPRPPAAADTCTCMFLQLPTQAVFTDVILVRIALV